MDGEYDRSFAERVLRWLPADLVAVGVLSVAAAVIILTPDYGLVSPVLRIVLGGLFVLFFPGYTLIAILFPERGREVEDANVISDSSIQSRTQAATDDNENPSSLLYRISSLLSRAVSENSKTPHRHGIDGIERLVLSIGFSIAITPLIGIGLFFSPFGNRPLTLVFFVAYFTTLCFIPIATARRLSVPPEYQYRVPVH